jgi:dGTPase
MRTGFEVDRDRIIHAETFRELQYKTQVQSLIHAPLTATFRTRLNHVIEVAQIAGGLARAIGADTTLSEAIALGHDLGHPPFGHAGERALRAALAEHGSPDWNANVHSLAVVDEVECAFSGFRGLDLTWATREGIARHSTPFDEPVSFGEFAGTPNGGIECQIVDAADVLAYLSHDLDDAIADAYIPLEELREISTLLAELLDLAEGEWNERGGEVWPSEDKSLVVRKAVVARLIARSIHDLGNSTRERVAKLGLDTPEDVRTSAARCVVQSEPYESLTRSLLSALTDSYYRSSAVRESDAAAGQILRELFEALLAEPGRIPARFHTDNLAVGVGTYVASLNDRTATALAEELDLVQPSSAV